MFFVPAILAASAIAGWVPGVIATLLSLCGSFYFMVDFPRLTAEEILSTAAFTAIAGGMVAFGQYLVRTRERTRTITKEILRREAHLQSILATVPDAMIVINDCGIIQSFSTAAEKLFGWRAADIIGKNVKLIMPSPFRERHDSYLQRYLSTGERHIIGIGRVIIGQRSDGSTFPIELSVGEMKSGNNRFFTGFLRDVSDQQKKDAKLRELQSELIHIARFTALGEMTSTLAHELNQPLSAIANYLKGSRRLLETGVDERSEIIRDAIDKAGDQALRAGRIIGQLRDFVTKGQPDQRVEDLITLIEEVGTLAFVGARESGVNIRVRLDPECGLVFVNKVQIQQVLFNLLRNAIESMNEVEWRELVVTSEPSDDGLILISVVDSGCGLSEEMASRIFQPFATTKPQGMGLGLPIARTIVEAHGGRIWTDPTAGGGTTFRFTLRAAATRKGLDHAG